MITFQVAALWGKEKNHENMTFKSLTRAMRYYYEKEPGIAKLYLP